MGLQIRIDGGYQIEKLLFFGYTYAHSALINLAAEPWDSMRYEQDGKILIDYPWEYDIQDCIIKAFLWANNKLNYLIQKEGKKFWIIQSADALESEDVESMDYWLFEGEAIAKKLDQLEMEGEKIDLGLLEKEEQ